MTSIFPLHVSLRRRFTAESRRGVAQGLCLESDVALREEFRGEAKFGTSARLAQPAVVELDQALDCHAGGELFGDEARRRGSRHRPDFRRWSIR
jgi:hypothetical protein